MAYVYTISSKPSLDTVYNISKCRNIIVYVPGIKHPKFDLDYYKFIQTALPNNTAVILLDSYSAEETFLSLAARSFLSYSRITDKVLKQSGKSESLLRTLLIMLARHTDEDKQNITVLAHAEGAFVLSVALRRIPAILAERVSVITLSSFIRTFACKLRSELHIFCRKDHLAKALSYIFTPVTQKRKRSLSRHIITSTQTKSMYFYYFYLYPILLSAIEDINNNATRRQYRAYWIRH